MDPIELYRQESEMLLERFERVLEFDTRAVTQLPPEPEEPAQ